MYLIEIFNLSGTRGYWQPEQKEAFNNAFKSQLKYGRRASSVEIRKAMREYPCLEAFGEAALRTRFSNLLLRQKKTNFA